MRNHGSDRGAASGRAWKGAISDVVTVTWAEWRRGLADRRFIGALVVSAIIGLGAALVFWRLGAAGSGNAVRAMLRTLLESLDALVLPLIAFFLGTSLMMGEWADGSIRNLLALPVTRGQLFLAKSLAGLGRLGLCLALVQLPMLGLSSLSAGGGFLTALPSLAIVWLGTWMYLGMLFLLGNSTALLVGSEGLAMLLCSTAVWFGMQGAALVNYRIARFLPTGLSDWHAGLANGSDPGGSLLNLLFLLGCYMLFTLPGLIRFEGREA